MKITSHYRYDHTNVKFLAQYRENSPFLSQDLSRQKSHIFVLLVYLHLAEVFCYTWISVKFWFTFRYSKSPVHDVHKHGEQSHGTFGVTHPVQKEQCGKGKMASHVDRQCPPLPHYPPQQRRGSAALFPHLITTGQHSTSMNCTSKSCTWGVHLAPHPSCRCAIVGVHPHRVVHPVSLWAAPYAKCV